MASPRSLPERRNPLVSPKHTPLVNLLVERRRLGQTELTVKPGQVNTTNATKADNLGMFDYAHLRVPLPKDLQGSGIFTLQRNQHYPEAYFLMRRSTDGFISATGMFKAAFPWAKQEQEEAEKKYIKNFPDTGPEEVAGNVWISPEAALELADEYGMRTWIEALLDPAPIAKGHNDPNKKISTPPRFNLPRPSSEDAPLFAPPVAEPASSRKRSLRSASPSKAPPSPSSRKLATPRRTRRARGTVGSSSLATAVESAEESSQPPEASVEPESVNGDVTAPTSVLESVQEQTLEEQVLEFDDVFKVNIQSTTEGVDEDELVTAAQVIVESTPKHSVTVDPQSYLDQAKAAIAEANRLTAGRAAGKKRKALEMLEDDDMEEEFAAIDGAPAPQSSEVVEPPTKRLRQTETELRKEKIKRRATLGIAASMAIGTLLPVFVSTFFSSL